MQDPNQNAASDNHEKHAKKQRLQYELTIADSDSKKIDREKEIELMEIKRLERQLALINVNIAERKETLKKIENEKMMIGNDIKTLKKKLNELI
jgi:hypothetical protein